MVNPSVMQLVWEESKDPNPGMFNPRQAFSNQHCLPRDMQSCSMLPPRPKIKHSHTTHPKPNMNINPVSRL